VRLAKHPNFEVEDHDLIYEAELAPWEVVLGVNLSVPTLDGRVGIKIPGWHAERTKTPRARTRPAATGRRARRFDCRRQIAIPSKITDTEKKLWEQLASESRFKPRD